MADDALMLSVNRALLSDSMHRCVLIFIQCTCLGAYLLTLGLKHFDHEKRLCKTKATSHLHHCFFLHGLDDFCGPCQEVFQKQHLRNRKDKHRRGYRLKSLNISPDIVPNTFCRPLDVDFQIMLYWFAIWVQSSVLWTEDTSDYKIAASCVLLKLIPCLTSMDNPNIIALILQTKFISNG